MRQEGRLTVKLLLAAMLGACLAVALPGTASAADAERPGVAGQAHAAGAASGDGGASVEDSEGCAIYFSSECQTDPVQAVGGDVLLNLNTALYNPCSYRVRDVRNWQVVRSGTFVGLWATTVGGLYSSYRLELLSCPFGAWGRIYG